MLNTLPKALTAPFSPQLNAATWTLANCLHPTGWDARDHAPTSLEELNACVQGTGRLAVWNGASGDTIFGDPETNYAFRAWHDWVHWRYQLPFTPDGEAAAAFVQVRHLVSRYGDGSDVVEMAALVLCEVMGQVRYEKQTDAFPVDQRQFAREHVGDWRTLAMVLVTQFGEDGVTDARAIKVAYSAWGGWC